MNTKNIAKPIAVIVFERHVLTVAKGRSSVMDKSPAKIAQYLLEVRVPRQVRMQTLILVR